MTQAFDVCVLGLGPVGTVSAACYAKQGFNVLGIDIDANRVRAIQEGRAPFAEPGIKDLLNEVIAEGRLQVSQDFALSSLADIIVIAVGTPTKEKPDLSQLDTVCAQIGVALRMKDDSPIIVIRSTVPPGTIRNRLAPIIERASNKRHGEGFFMASNPEFLREGTAIADFFETGRIIIGADNKEAAERIGNLYCKVEADARLYVSVESAEFAKYVDNTWHALKVSFANEIGRVCQAFGGKIEETTEIFLSDDHLNISPTYLRPGFAFGGSCLPKDVRGLSWLAHSLHVEVPVVDAILPSNNEHIDLGLHNILAKNPKRVGLLGVAFKEHVDDLRESPALAIARELMAQGIEVAAHDPAYKPGDVLTMAGSSYSLKILDADELARDVDTLVILHRLPLYYALVTRYADRAVVDLTKFPEAANENYSGRKTFKSEKSAAWSLGEAHSGSFPPKNDTKKTPSMPMLSRVRKTIFG